MLDPFTPRHTPEPDAEWVSELRSEANAALENLELPTSRQEDWRFTQTERLSLDDLTLADGGVFEAEIAREIADELGDRSVLVAAGAAISETETSAVTVEPLSQATGDGSQSGLETDVFAALNARHFGPGVAIDVAAGSRVEQPIVVVNWLGADGVAAFDRTRVRVGERAQAAVMEIWASPDGLASGLAAPVTHLTVADGAQLDYVAIQSIDAGANFVGAAQARQGRDSRLTTAIANLGAGVGRHRLETHLVGEGADYRALGLYIGDGDRNIDFRTLQHHVAKHTTSRLLYRGAVWDASRSIYSGLIRIEPDAARSDANQASHYLILSEDAEAASIPNLEIFNHDVSCGHATSGGPPDEDQIYYLASRGIAPDVAERLIVDGFFNDVISALPLEGAREVVLAEVTRLLAQGRSAAA